MICPECKSNNHYVRDSRPKYIVITKKYSRNYTYRRRECNDCGHRWSTIEVCIVDDGKDLEFEVGIRESFNEIFDLMKESLIRKTINSLKNNGYMRR